MASTVHRAGFPVSRETGDGECEGKNEISSREIDQYIAGGGHAPVAGSMRRGGICRESGERKG